MGRQLSLVHFLESIARWCCFRVSCWWLSSSVWRWSSSAEVSFQRHPEAARATNTQQTWRQEFLGSRSSTVERSSTPLWRLKRLVTLSTYRRYINECIYLSIYLTETRCKTGRKSLTNIKSRLAWHQNRWHQLPWMTLTGITTADALSLR